MAAHQAPPSLGFSRQEHWSGLPFPSPMHESEKWKWSCQLCPTLSNPMDYSLPGSSIHGILQARALEQGAIAFSTSRASVQFSSVAQSCLTLCDPMNRSTPGLPVHHQLLMVINVFSNGDAYMYKKNITNTGMLPCSVKWKPNNSCWEGKTPSLRLRFLE